MNTDDKTRQRFNKLQKRLRREMGQAIADYKMIEEGDRIMVCLSGGKDSYTMLDILLTLQQSAPINFELLVVNLDQKQPGFPEHILPEYLASLGVAYHVIEQDTYSVVKRVIPEGKTTCGLCSRMRRGALYAYAEEHAYNKIALGHHRDDIIETFFLNMFHGGQLKAMPAKLKSDNGKHIVIRPLAYAREKDIEEFAKLKAYPIIPCNLCGSQDGLQRVQMKKMLSDWDQQFPGRIETIFNSLKNIRPSQLLDNNMFDFENFSQAKNDGEADVHSQPVVFSALRASK
ncbi:MAG: tRNA 2-thiocytidine(32) synthetase TtcA [Cycloclasticus sp.]|nr:tRNA 2-thiocytidine(32) synthetase TtcA [Cycloclasticus sp. 46_83_sub15_T18]OUR83219.1 tRNA 2-thiocytidine(32) synthetase TtcA [Cycloclasticus sp. 46_120_T64]